MSRPPGSMHGQPAVVSAQQAVGRRGGLPARLCTHDDEAGSGKMRLICALTVYYMQIHIFMLFILGNLVE